MSRIAFIIINYNTPRLTLDCLESFYKLNEQSDFEPIVVDNHSSDDSIEVIKASYPSIKIIQNEANNGYAYAVNRGMEGIVSDYAIIANSDIILPNGALKELIDFLKNNSNAAVCGPQQVYGNGAWQLSYGPVPSIRLALQDLIFYPTIRNRYRNLKWKIIGSNQRAKKTEYMDGGILAVRTKVFRELSGFDENFFFYSEECDFCARARKLGYDVYYNPKAVVKHLRGASSGSGESSINKIFIAQFAKSSAYFVKKHFSDGYYRRYLKFEILYASVNIIIYTILSVVAFGVVKRKAEHRVKFARALKEGFTLIIKS